MDQVKIGRFIAECRKKNNLTQMQLAERLNITDRAVSKWECGKAMPDSSIMLELCGVLKISVTDLLSGEVVTVENYNEKAEQRLLEIVKEKELADRRLLGLEILIGVLSTIIIVAATFVASFVDMQPWARILIIAIGAILGIIGIGFAIRIEQVAGYYECKCCGYKYVPTYKAVSMAMHMGRTRYLKCPKCEKKSWQKKVISKD